MGPDSTRVPQPITDHEQRSAMHHISFICYISVICKLYQRCVFTVVIHDYDTSTNGKKHGGSFEFDVSLPGEPKLNGASLQLLIDTKINYQYILYTFKCFRFTHLFGDCATETT